MVSPPWVVSPRPGVCVQNSPSQGTASISASTSSLPGEVTRRTWKLPVLRPSRTTRLRRKPRWSRRSHGIRPLAAALGEHQLAQLVAPLGGEHAVLQRQDPVEAAGRVEAADELAVLAGPERVLELVAVAPLLQRGHDRLLLEALEAADALQRLGDLLGLDLELALVGEHLPRRARVVGDLAGRGPARAPAARPRARRRSRAWTCRRRRGRGRPARRRPRTRRSRHAARRRCRRRRASRRSARARRRAGGGTAMGPRRSCLRG